MLKLLLTGLWVCIVTLGAVYFSVQMSAAPAPVDEEAKKKELLEVVRGEAITVPMIANGNVQGYFIGRISFMMDKEKSKEIKLPITELMTDQLFTLLVGNKMVDLSKPGAFDLDKFKSTIKDGMNTKFGDQVVAEVLVEQLDYMSKEDIRTNAAKGGKGSPPVQKIVDGVTVEAPAAASAGH
jgi:flagellar basal body-associated protein FliL